MLESYHVYRVAQDVDNVIDSMWREKLYCVVRQQANQHQNIDSGWNTLLKELRKSRVSSRYGKQHCSRPS